MDARVSGPSARNAGPVAPVNFYKHHLGDYSSATSHLSWDEDCAYRRLIDAYYKRETPIPADIKEAQRLARAQTPGQRKAVETVLHEFFHLDSDGWHQKRCDEELAKANAQGETNRRIAEEREARKRERLEHEQSTNRDTDRATNRSPATSGEREPSHKPLATSHKPEKDQRERGNVTTEADPPWLRKALTPDLTPSKSRKIPEAWQPDELTLRWVNDARPDLVAHLADIVENFREYWQTRTGVRAESTDWGLTFRRWIRNERDRSDGKAKDIDWDKVFGEQAEGAA